MNVMPSRPTGTEGKISRKLLIVLGCVLGLAAALGIVSSTEGPARATASTIGAASLMLLIVVLYFLPYFLAKQKKHPHLTGIGVLNVFLGWTVLGWIGALVWAVTPPRETPGRP